MFCKICSFLFFCGCIVRTHEPIVYPDKPLQEIIIHGSYYPEEKGEREEEYRYSGRKYCYKKTEEDQKFKSFKKKRKGFLKVQLYSQEGELLTETFFIMEKDDIYNNYSIQAYLPFHEDAHEQRIVRIDRNKEVMLNSIPIDSIDTIIRRTVPLTVSRGIAWHYDPEIECHIAPGPQ